MLYVQVEVRSQDELKILIQSALSLIHPLDDVACMESKSYQETIFWLESEAQSTLSIISIKTKQSIELGSLLREACESKTEHSIQLHVHGKLPHMVSISLHGAHGKTYASTKSTTPCAAATRLSVAPAPHQMLCTTTTGLPTAAALHHLRRASGCFGTSRGLSRDSSSTTSTTPRIRVPRHVVRLVTRLVADNFVSRRLVVDYFAYAARPGALARRAARHAACR
jgi:hypothetical protein